MTEERNYRRHGARYKARRRAVEILFEAETRDIDPVAVVEDRKRLSSEPNSDIPPVNPYTAEIVQGAAERLDELDELIAKYLSDNWELHRIPALDRAILRAMAWEILYNDDVDAPISVVEAVEIASEYSTDVAPPYIHAVLDDIVQAQSDSNPMNQDIESDEDDTDVSEGNTEE